jgi:hypothetical protein
MKVLRSRKQILNNVLKYRRIAAENWEIAVGGLIARPVIY